MYGASVRVSGTHSARIPHVPYSQRIHVFPDLEAAFTLLVDFCGGFIT